MSKMTQSDRPTAAQLTPALSEQFALRLPHLLITAGFSLLFLFFNYIPVPHASVWDHVAIGDWILQHRAIPAEIPFVPLAEGMRLTDDSWLSEVILAAVNSSGGADLISHVFALTVLATSLVLFRAFFLQTGSSGFAFLGVVLVQFVNWSRHAVLQPELFGKFCFAVLLWLLVSMGRIPAANRRISRRYWFAIPALFMVWANLHSSFVAGLAVLACCVAGRAFEVCWSSRSLRSIFSDKSVRRGILLFELALCATLLNPYGADLLVSLCMKPLSPNLEGTADWLRLQLVSPTGIEVGISWLLLAVLLRHSKSRVSPTDVLLLAVFSVAVCLRVHRVAWYAPVVVLVLMPHIADVSRQLLQGSLSGIRGHFAPVFENRSFRYTLFTGLVLWVAFSLSPFSQFVLGKEDRLPQRLHSRSTPHGVMQYLNENPPAGQIHHPSWWGGWLQQHGPEGMQTFLTTHALGMVPERVWTDHRIIEEDRDGLFQMMDRYRINTIVTDKERQRSLSDTLRGLTDWDVVFEDEIGLVAVRSRSRSDAMAEPSKKTVSD
jgi:hypothetical protein